MRITDRDLHHIAADIDRCGITGDAEHDVANVVAAARDAGVRGAAVDVLADRGAPEVARIRAYGIVATRLWLARRRPTGPSTTVLASAV